MCIRNNSTRVQIQQCLLASIFHCSAVHCTDCLITLHKGYFWIFKLKLFLDLGRNEVVIQIVDAICSQCRSEIGERERMSLLGAIFIANNHLCCSSNIHPCLLSFTLLSKCSKKGWAESISWNGLCVSIITSTFPLKTLIIHSGRMLDLIYDIYRWQGDDISWCCC